MSHPYETASPCRRRPRQEGPHVDCSPRLSHRECAPTGPCEDAEDAGLRRRRGSPEEGDDGEEDEEEHSCRACRQVFDSLSDLAQHKINQCQLTASWEVFVDVKVGLRSPTPDSVLSCLLTIIPNSH
ncbi:hypothetical protein P4O66_000970 [Electrophorus voltai]|uniref:C2H2-type domain-containing protein n=1 Tax=Electrophorus voltai TaxID=2609070 RepID=A0AAD8ZCL4_9TELE|nr:hypothetical protein P4O66_000970 [Electrophorus voltai]